MLRNGEYFQTEFWRELMRDERRRLETFRTWTSNYQNKEELARFGFFYVSNTLDTVRCFECQVEVNRWEDDDDPARDHVRWSPHCRFMRGLRTTNIPIDGTLLILGLAGIDEVSENEALNAGEDVAGALQPSTISLITGIESYHSWGDPEYPEFSSPVARLKSLLIFPPGLKMCDREIANAGLFYQGVSDQLRCFYCGEVFSQWNGKGPLEAHSEMYDVCKFIKIMVNAEIREKKKNIPSFIDKIRKNEIKLRKARRDEKIFEFLIAKPESSSETEEDLEDLFPYSPIYRNYQIIPIESEKKPIKSERKNKKKEKAPRSSEASNP